MAFGHIECDGLQSGCGVLRSNGQVLNEFAGHINQGVLWPRVEPIDGRSVYDPRELSGFDSEIFSDGGKAIGN